MILIIKAIRRIGYLSLVLLSSTGRFIQFTAHISSLVLRTPFYFYQIIEQIKDFCYLSLPIIGLTTLFTGMALVFQSKIGFSRISDQETVAVVVVLSMTRELSPVLVGLVTTIRFGTIITEEIRSMKINEQIDALSIMSINPLQYLITPRLIAGALTLPFFTLIGDAIGTLGGYLASSRKFYTDYNSYMIQTLEYLGVIDIISGLIKAFSFGFFIILISFYHEFSFKNGNVPRTETTTVDTITLTIIVILLLNYILTVFFFGVS